MVANVLYFAKSPVPECAEHAIARLKRRSRRSVPGDRSCRSIFTVRSCCCCQSSRSRFRSAPPSLSLRRSPCRTSSFGPPPTREPPCRAGNLPAGTPLSFAGFSGVPEREKASGFTMVGPCYGGEKSRRGMLAAAERAGLKFAYSIGINMQFTGKKRPTQAHGKRDQGADRGTGDEGRGPREHLLVVLAAGGIATTGGNGMAYLRTMTDTIRALDPKNGRSGCTSRTIATPTACADRPLPVHHWQRVLRQPGRFSRSPGAWPTP